MAKNITLTIYMPERRVLEKQIYRVVLPCNGSTLTVIDERAPTLLSLDMGVIKILDEDMNITEEYYVSGGAVDVHDNSCTILTEGFYNSRELSLDKARELLTENQTPFIEWIVNYLQKKKHS